MAVVVDGVVGVNGCADLLLGPPKKKKTLAAAFVMLGSFFAGLKNWYTKILER